MRAIVIDSEKSEIREAQIPKFHDSGASFIQGIVGGHFSSAGIVSNISFGVQHVLFVDDEGLLKDKAGYFTYRGLYHPTRLGFAGSGVIVGVNEVGETVPARIQVEQVRRMVNFVRVSSHVRP